MFVSNHGNVSATVEWWICN